MVQLNHAATDESRALIAASPAPFVNQTPDTGPGSSHKPATTGSIVSLALGPACICGMAALQVWLAVTTWRNPDRFERTAWTLSTRVGISVGRGLARKVAVLAGAFVCLTCFMLSGILGMASPTPGI